MRRQYHQVLRAARQHHAQRREVVLRTQVHGERAHNRSPPSVRDLSVRHVLERPQLALHSEPITESLVGVRVARVDALRWDPRGDERGGHLAAAAAQVQNPVAELVYLVLPVLHLFPGFIADH